MGADAFGAELGDERAKTGTEVGNLQGSRDRDWRGGGSGVAEIDIEDGLGHVANCASVQDRFIEDLR